MPMGNGLLFLPVNAAIRKKTGKKAGDKVQIILYADNDPLEIPENLLICLKENENEYKTYLSYNESEQKAFIDWINDAKNEDLKVERISKTLNALEKGLKFKY